MSCSYDGVPEPESTAELSAIQQALDSCSLPWDPAGVPECNLCTRAAYAEYRAFHCSHNCDLGYQLPYVDYLLCKRYEREYHMKSALCKAGAQEESSSFACCTGFDWMTGAKLAWSFAVGGLWSGVAGAAGKAVGNAVGQSNVMTICPPNSVLCQDESSCGKTKWCVPVHGDCTPEDPDMPSLCGVTADQYGACEDPHRCPPGYTKIIRRRANVPAGYDGQELCVPEKQGHKCEPFATPPTCPDANGTCKPCDSNNCPLGARWDSIKNGCTSCPAGQAVSVNDTTGATSCVTVPLCASGASPVDFYPDPGQCPLGCEAPLTCKWSTVSLCGDPCWICPYCNQGSF